MSEGERGPKGDPGDIIEHGQRGERGPKGDVGSPGRGDGNGYPDGMPAWLKILLVSLRQFGVATIILLIGGYWLAVRIAEPLMATYNESIRVQNKVVQDQAVTLKKIGETFDERQKFSERAERTMGVFAETSLKNQNQLLRDHQDFMAELRRVAPPPAPNKPGT